jgi:endothelin-converting enzyme
LKWLDPKSRAAAEDKASAIGIKIGYATSPNVTDPVALRSYYALNEPIKGEYFESVLGSRMTDERRKWFKVGRERDPGMWDMIPTEASRKCTRG